MKNSLEKFGPVRTVKPELVLRSPLRSPRPARHKSGVALRFPADQPVEKDKGAAEIGHTGGLGEDA